MRPPSTSPAPGPDGESLSSPPLPRPSAAPPPIPRHAAAPSIPPPPPPSAIESVPVSIKRLRDVPLPAYQTALAAGMDLHACVDAPLAIAPNARVLVPTGLAIALPPGFEAQVRPRSGLAWRAGVTVLNSPGTIDADYRGEVKVLLVNLGTDEVVIAPGERIAQMVVARHARAELLVVDDLDDTARGAGGYGSTGA